MTHTRVLSLLQWIGWGIILVLCVTVALLWSRMERQVARNAADIVAMKADSDAEDIRLQQEAREDRARLERRWGQFLMPTLRQHHEAIQSMPLALEHVQPLPDWLQEKR